VPDVCGAMKITLDLDPREPAELREAQSVLKHIDYWLALFKISNSFNEERKLSVEQFNEILNDYGITLEEIG